MDNIGFSSYPIKIITLDKLIDEFISDECKRKSIICSDKYYNKLTREFFELKNNIYRIHFPGGASGKKPTCQFRRCKRHRFDPGLERSLE